MRLPSHSVAGIGHIGNLRALRVGSWGGRGPAEGRGGWPSPGRAAPGGDAGPRLCAQVGRGPARYRDPVPDPAAVDVERAGRPWRRLAAGLVLAEAVLVLA